VNALPVNVPDDPGRTRLAVLGSPIAHSKSPAIQRAAYGVLGLDWEYGMADVTGAALPDYLGGLDERWRGLSLTMPLKRDVLPLLDRREPLVDVVGGANTVRLTEQGVLGANTDVHGVEQALRDAAVTGLDLVHILGAGATAAAVIAGVARLGARRVLVRARTPANAEPLIAVGERVGVEVVVRPIALEDRSLVVPDAVVSTLPGHAEHGLVFPEAVRAGSVLFDVAYDPWPSALAQAWTAPVVSGLDMLIHQAVGQLRFWLHGDSEHVIDREPAVVAAMRAAVG
jgi:shikimate dehydrogenase